MRHRTEREGINRLRDFIVDETVNADKAQVGKGVFLAFKFADVLFRYVQFRRRSSWFCKLGKQWFCIS